MSEVTLYEGDSYAVLRRMAARGEMVASVCCDPPYGLTSIIDRFGKGDAKAAKFGRDGAYGRYSAGFMGQSWDGTGVERDPLFWKLVYDVLAPGGYIVAFSSARTYQKMATAIEIAGFVTHPMIVWCYASGLAKPHNAKAEGLEGWRHGGQVRKPAIEPIYVGQKPFKGSMAECIRSTGIGAVNIDGIRTAVEDGLGRYPANLITDGSPEVASLFPIADGQRGASTTAERRNNVYYAMSQNREPMQPRADAGSAMRFFEQYEHSPFDGEPLIYNKKADKEDRAGSNHASVKPIALMQSLVRHVTPPGMTTLDPFAGTGTTGVAALREGVSAILIEASPAYAQTIRGRLTELTPAGSAYLNSIGAL